MKRLMQSLIENRDSPNIIIKEEWCRQCGLCCHDKTYNGYIVEYLSTTCQWLGKNGKCSIYKERTLEKHNCVHAKTALLLCMLPRHCPYVEKNWKHIKRWYISPSISRSIYSNIRKNNTNLDM